MNSLVILLAIVGLALAQHYGDTRDCDQRQDSFAGREGQDSYQRSSAYDSGDYVPHNTYGPPDLVRPPPRRNYPQDNISEGANGPRPAYALPPSYNTNRSPPVYGPAPSRARAAAAAGIYDDYDDIPYAQPPPPPPPPARFYHVNYARREPYQLGYDVYSNRQYRVPVYYAPLIPDGFIPVHSHLTSTTEKPTTEEIKSSPSAEAYHSDHHHHNSTTQEEEVYDEEHVRRQQPTIIAVDARPDHDFKKHLFKKPFIGLRNLFRGSILAKRDKIGLIPSIIQGSTNNF